MIKLLLNKKKIDYERRLYIPITGSTTLKLFTASCLHVSTGYVRVVIGGRGPYIEFEKIHLIHDNIHVPENQLWRLNPKYTNIFYYEWRTNLDYVKIYEQKKVVDYADYKVGMWYISPFDLYDLDGYDVIKKTEVG